VSHTVFNFPLFIELAVFLWEIMNDPKFQSDLRKCIEILWEGGLILYPTDTIWGIGCDATNDIAVKKIFELKKRSDRKTLIVLVAEERDILKYVSSPDWNIFNFLKTTQKPTTIIYEGAIGLAENVIDTEGRAAIRIVKEIFCKQLIKQFGRPIVSTSANMSGQSTPQLFDDISEEIKNGVGYVVSYRRDEQIKHEASSILKFEKNGSLTVLRP
jgi:L-threonylcarbamoyladenylate synthase